MSRLIAKIKCQELFSLFYPIVANSKYNVYDGTIKGATYHVGKTSNTGNTYNAEAIATLIQAMENHRDDLVVIFAGYTKEMQAFLDSNSGIVSRIGYTLEFEDYTEDELVDIFKGMVKKAGFTVEDAAIDKLRTIINEYKPDAISVEELFFNNNAKTAINVAQARGVILTVGCKNNIPTFEYTPLQIKQALTGYGRAEKNQIQQMVKSLLGLKAIPKPDDAADALAVAIVCGISYLTKPEEKYKFSNSRKEQKCVKKNKTYNQQ